MKMKRIFLVLVIALLSACNLPQRNPLSSPGETPTTGGTLPIAAAATAAPGPAGTPPAAAYPDTPEGVIQAFVEAYPEDTNGMLGYLSAALRAGLPAGGPGLLLNVQGDINGFLILSGAAVPDPPSAEFLVALQAGTEQVQRTFFLTKENGRWVITGVH